MADKHQTNAMDSAEEVANHPTELEQAQIICVIGKVSFTPLRFLTIGRLLMDEVQADPALAKAHNAKGLLRISALPTCLSATFSGREQARCWRTRGLTSWRACETASWCLRKRCRAYWRMSSSPMSKRERAVSCWMAFLGVWNRRSCSKVALVLNFSIKGCSKKH